jgi:hypothetical protein
VRKGDDLTTFIVPKVEKIRSLNVPDPPGPAQACSGKPLPNYCETEPCLGKTIFIKNVHFRTFISHENSLFSCSWRFNICDCTSQFSSLSMQCHPHIEHIFGTANCKLRLAVHFFELYTHDSITSSAFYSDVSCITGGVCFSMFPVALFN